MDFADYLACGRFPCFSQQNIAVLRRRTALFIARNRIAEHQKRAKSQIASVLETSEVAESSKPTIGKELGTKPLLRGIDSEKQAFKDGDDFNVLFGSDIEYDDEDIEAISVSCYDSEEGKETEGSAQEGISLPLSPDLSNTGGLSKCQKISEEKDSLVCDNKFCFTGFECASD